MLDQQRSHETGQPAGLLESWKDIGLFERLVVTLDVGLNECGRGCGGRDRHWIAGRDLAADLPVGEQDPLEDPVVDHEVLGRWDPRCWRR
jgi:hypothetical protein